MNRGRISRWGQQACWAAALLGAVAGLPAADERGGSFTLAPAVLMPAGRLGQAFHGAPQANLHFDIGISPRWSVIFGAAYAELVSKLNRDSRLMLAPAWFGFKSKAQIGPSIEVFWDTALEAVYEKHAFYHSGVGSIENLGGGMMLGTGLDLWLTGWLLAGIEARTHLIKEGDEVFPFVQWGLRIGLRG